MGDLEDFCLHGAFNSVKRWCAAGGAQKLYFPISYIFSSNCHNVESGLVTSPVTPTCLDEMGLLSFEFASALSGQNRDMTVEQAMMLLDEVTVITFHILSHPFTCRHWTCWCRKKSQPRFRIKPRDFMWQCWRFGNDNRESPVVRAVCGSPRNLSGRAAWLASSTLQVRHAVAGLDPLPTPRAGWHG